MKTFVAAAARFGSGRAGCGSAKEGAWARCSIVFAITGGGFVLLLVGWLMLYCTCVFLLCVVCLIYPGSIVLY